MVWHTALSVGSFIIAWQSSRILLYLSLQATLLIVEISNPIAPDLVARVNFYPVHDSISFFAFLEPLGQRTRDAGAPELGLACLCCGQETNISELGHRMSADTGKLFSLLTRHPTRNPRIYDMKSLLSIAVDATRLGF